MPIATKSLDDSVLLNVGLLNNGMLAQSAGTIAGVDYLADSEGYILQDSDGVFLQSAD